MSKASNIILLDKMRQRYEKQIKAIRDKPSNSKHGIGDRFVLKSDAAAEIRRLRAMIKKIDERLEAAVFD